MPPAQPRSALCSWMMAELPTAGKTRAPRSASTLSAPPPAPTDDQGNTGSGGPLTDTDAVAITVNAVNDSPIATAKSFSAQANMKILRLTGLLSGATDPDTGDGGYAAAFSV